VIVEHGWYGNGPYAGWGSVTIADASTGANAVELDFDPYIEIPTVAVSGDGNVIAVGVDWGDMDIQLYDPTGAHLPIAPMQGIPLALSEDGSQIAVGAIEPYQSGGTIEVRNVSDGAVVKTIPITTWRRAAVTSDLGHVLIGDAPPHVLTVRSFDDEEEGVACGSGNADPYAWPTGLWQSTDGAVLVETLTTDGTDAIQTAWNVETGEVVDVPPAESLEGPSAISPDGLYEARASADYWSANFEVVDRATGAVVRTFGPHPSRVIGLEWSADGALIASSSERDPVDRRGPAYVKLWDAATGALVQDIETDAERTALFHTSGARLFVPTEGTTAVWCTASP
jgi:WD40 repeat protein